MSKNTLYYRSTPCGVSVRDPHCEGPGNPHHQETSMSDYNVSIPLEYPFGVPKGSELTRSIKIKKILYKDDLTQ